MDAMKSNGPPEDGPTDVPPKLVAALKSATNRRIFVPPSLDAAILRAAREHLTTPEQPRWVALRRWLLWPGLAAASAALLLLVYTGFWGQRTVFAIEDLNHDGRIDVLDALQLARQLQNGPVPPPTFDFNGDGVVDRRDAELIATHAVQLKKGRRS